MKSKAPPVFARRLLRWLIADAIYNDLEGDLLELYHDRVEAMGTFRARAHYYKDVLLSGTQLNIKEKTQFL